MTTANEQIRNIQSRIDELEQTISDRSDQIKSRTNQLKEDLREELSPLEIIRKHPLESVGITFITGIVAGRGFKSVLGPKRRCTAKSKTAVTEFHHEKQPSPVGVAIGAIGVELLHTARDLAITWIKNRVVEKKNQRN
ncbi:MAG: hypothetical protein HGA97_11150 [Chlorobiaceae bacterium]|nr:hypothetical protein [Chlorobiaceae bacterium]